MGRSLSWAPARAASAGSAPLRHSMAMNVTSMTELEIDTPMHMIEPMNDSMFSDVRVKNSISTTPLSTPGTALTALNASRGTRNRPSIE